MEEPEDIFPNDVDYFFDALDELPQDDPSESPQITFSNVEDVIYQAAQSPSSSPRLHRRFRRGSSSKGSEAWYLEENVISTSEDLLPDEKVVTDRDNFFKSDENGTNFERSLSPRSSVTRDILEDQQEVDKSRLTSFKVEDLVYADWPGESSRSSGFLIFLARMVVKALGLQFQLLSTLLKLPYLSFYYFFALVINPYGTIKGLWDGAYGSILSFFYKWRGEYMSILRITLRFSWGFLWCIYIFTVLGGLLVSSFAMSFLTLRFILNEPIHMKEALYLDYTKESPVAYVPITYCPDVPCGTRCKEKIEPIQHLHVMHPNHKFQVTIILELPETEYNRNLGIFQVRVDSVSPSGEILATSRHPCMFPFRSHTVHLIMTYLKILPLLAGYLAESQTISLRIRDFNEGPIPTACLAVMVEQRAEYKAGAGIPEIYAASLLLESELPFLKRVLWNWRKTVFVWLSMVLFMMGFLLILVCCSPLLLPRSPLTREPIASHVSASQSDLPAGIEMG